MGPAPGWIVQSRSGFSSLTSWPSRGAIIRGWPGAAVEESNWEVGADSPARRHATRQPIAADRQHPPTLIFPKQNDRDRVSTEEAIALEGGLDQADGKSCIAAQVDAAGLGCHAP